MATATRKPRKTTDKVKAKCLGFINWSIGNIKSRKGFGLYENDYLTKEDQILLDLAKENGGSVTVMAELRITLNNDTPKELDLSQVQIISSANDKAAA